MSSAAYPQLRDLEPGDRVPVDLHVLDYRDGTRPRWTVAQAEELESGGRRLTLVDPDNGPELDGVAVTVLTWSHKTLKSQPHRLGRPIGNTLCDLDQQGRREALV